MERPFRGIILRLRVTHQLIAVNLAISLYHVNGANSYDGTTGVAIIHAVRIYLNRQLGRILHGRRRTTTHNPHQRSITIILSGQGDRIRFRAEALLIVIHQPIGVRRIVRSHRR